MYKVVEGHELAINKDDYIQQQRQGQAIWATQYTDHKDKTLFKTILPITQRASKQYQLKLFLC